MGLGEKISQDISLLFVHVYHTQTYFCFEINEQVAVTINS